MRLNINIKKWYTDIGFGSISEDKLWRLYNESKGIKYRDELVGLYMPFTKVIAQKIFYQRISDEVEFNDYLQYARIGMLESIDLFDHAKGVQFKTYAQYRIKGAILGGLANFTEKRQQLAYIRRKREERLRSLQHDNDSQDTNALFEQIADTAISLALGYMLEDANLANSSEKEHSSNLYTRHEFIEFQEFIKMIVTALPDKERQIIEYHYYHERSFVEIAELMNISKGRVSQLHRLALIVIREVYSDIGNFTANY